VAVAELPRLVLPGNDITRLCQGRAISLAVLPPVLEPLADADEVAVFDQANELVLLATWDRPKGLLKPAKVFSPPKQAEA